MHGIKRVTALLVISLTALIVSPLLAIQHIRLISSSSMTQSSSYLNQALARPRSDVGHLRGSSASLDRQQIARRRANMKLHRDRSSVMRSVRRGELRRVRETRTLKLANVSYPYAHPELKALLNRLSVLYMRRCQTPLVVTSLTRPTSEQPRNASTRSVHPAGLAADLRVPYRGCRKWLSATLSAWERAGILEATRERRPPHFHIVAFPHKLTLDMISRLEGGGSGQVARSKRRSAQKRRAHKGKAHKRRAHKRRVSRAPRRPNSRAKRGHKQRHASRRYRVRRGDSWWRIAHKFRISQDSLRRANRRSKMLHPGQVLTIPL